jgi:hypothetical protein
MSSRATLKPQRHGACPKFFLALCREASRGGTDGYEWAAYSLAGALAGLGPYDLDENEWAGKLDELSALIDREDDAGILAWFDTWLPRCMALVPKRRRAAFLRGVSRQVVEEGNGIEY